MASVPASERRFERIRIDSPPVVLEPWGVVNRARLIDISPDGCRIEIGRAELSDGQHILLRGRSLVGASGVVRWAANGCAGIQFDRILPPDTLKYMIRDNREGLQIILPNSLQLVPQAR